MKILVLFPLSLLIAGCASINESAPEYAYSKNLDYAQMVNLHHRQSKTMRGLQYEAYKLVPEHNKFWPSIVKKCRPLILDEGVQSFEFVFVVNNDGSVIDAKSKMASKGISCFLDGVKTIKYPAPPYETWYELVNVE